MTMIIGESTTNDADYKTKVKELCQSLLDDPALKEVFESIDKFMQQQKDDADRSKKKRKKDEENNNRRNTWQRNGGNQNNSNNKIRIDQKARTGPTSKCKKHPDLNHAWGDCHLNPNNLNNKLGNRNNFN